uniref:Uncharacterized protein n=1 Tax=Rhizoctonia cerealis phyllomonavirus TaxID=3068671 RepID=A0AA51BSC3_9MONO|nr:MAG: hypothetical protein [Rhizoctonia cerealis phyllomonavirus]
MRSTLTKLFKRKTFKPLNTMDQRTIEAEAAQEQRDYERALTMGALLPDLRVERFRKAVKVGRVGLPSSALPTEREVADFILFPEISRDVRATILWILTTLDVPTYSERKQWCWLLTALDLIAPGFVLNHLASHFSLRVIRASDDDVKSLADFYSKGTRQNTDVGGMERFRNIDPDLAARPIELGNQDAQTVDMVYAANWWGILFFGIGKAATEQNISAFRERRPRALLGKAGMDKDDTYMAEEVLPNLAQLRWVAGRFSMRPRIREALTKELIRWTRDAPTFACEVVATHVKLWEGQGLNHLRMVRTLVNAYYPALARIPGLREQIEAAAIAWDSYHHDKDPYKAFSRVIYGDRENYGRSRDYSDLLMIARDVISRTDPKMSQYASGNAPSAYLAIFEGLCKNLRLLLPERQETAGGAQ